MIRSYYPKSQTLSLNILLIKFVFRPLLVENCRLFCLQCHICCIFPLDIQPTRIFPFRLSLPYPMVIDGVMFLMLKNDSVTLYFVTTYLLSHKTYAGPSIGTLNILTL